MRLREWARARALKRDIVALWLAARDPRVPFAAKMLAGFVAAYALSPIDLIPDFIPVFGYLDDLLIVPLGIWLALRLIPPDLMAELRDAATERARPTSYWAAGAVVAFWLVIAALTAGWAKSLWTS
ncbi:MAG: DUF1232 domain-containing protein [Sphingobium sp.]|nr:DUF1232 domain-containing protein [Sphingobium sp.]